VSIEKEIPNRLRHEKVEPFTIILNETLNAITDPGALGIYCFLASKPADWDIQNQHLMNHFKKGREYIENRLKHLREIGALVTVPVRDDNGRFIARETHLKRKILPTIRVSQSVGKPESGESATTKERSLQKKEDTKKDICTSVPDMPITARTPKTSKPKNLATKEEAELISVWNEIAGAEGCKKVGIDKRQLKSIQSHIRVIKQKWEVELSPKSFKTWLVAGIEAQCYMLTTYHHSMDICLRWRNFNEIYNKIEGKE
jgi:hypothetical protein